MAKEKDELISGSELSRRIKVTPQYINKKKDTLKSCRYGKKYYFRKSCLALGYDPDNLPTEKKENNQTKKTVKEQFEQSENWNVVDSIDDVIKHIDKKVETPKPQKTPPPHPQKPKQNKEVSIDSIDELYSEILEAIADPDTTYDKLKLDGLNAKAKTLKEFELATHQRLKNKQLEENLYTYQEIESPILQAVAIFDNALNDLANNGASNLEGLNKKQIKEWLTDYVSEIKEDFIKILDQFKQ